MKSIELKQPYLIFTGDTQDRLYAKTGIGIAEWRPELCKGQLSLPEGTVDLGLPTLTLQEAKDAGVGSLILGTAMIGGQIPESWLAVLLEAAKLGIDVVAGVHSSLNDVSSLKEAAALSGAQLIDVRVPPKTLPVGSGKKRTGQRILTVGTDCALGKKYTALALEKDMKAAGMNADFRASGQTGIMIAGNGIPIDAVVSDFISGAAELLSPDNTSDHWDIVEGQGSLFHPGYIGVSAGLLMGSQPDVFIVCHEAGRTHHMGWEDIEIPSIDEVIERTIAIGVKVNLNIKCIGASVNTSKLSINEAEAYLTNLSNKLGLPCVDPIRNGTQALIENLN